MTDYVHLTVLVPYLNLMNTTTGLYVLSWSPRRFNSGYEFFRSLPLLSMQWVSISDALARFATKEMTLPPPQFTMTTFLNLFPSLPCLHAFAQHSFLSSPPQRMLPVRVFADKKIVVGHLCSLPHHLSCTHPLVGLARIAILLSCQYILWVLNCWIVDAHATMQF